MRKISAYRENLGRNLGGNLWGGILWRLLPTKRATSANKGSDLLVTSANNLSSASPSSAQLSVPAFLERRSP